jgi:hypothetical protein
VPDSEHQSEGGSPGGLLAKGGPVRFLKVEPGEEKTLPDREQRKLDNLPSALDSKNKDD